MNKNIFSLVCIILYTLLAVSIHCSEQKSDRSKTYGLRSRVIRAIQKIKKSNKKNDIEPQRENQSNNNNNYDYERYRGPYEDEAPFSDCCGLC
ncbi:fam-c protein [Plasmodium vinckei vinckei]|uniref:Fam-c protein n=1 Tax=Plasmodium vinckei vinckei TaxID=54757 RepID=A0A449BVZ7_PLAVN|nr:fam-c protein [Plasmodium vinckei vinckei]KEG03315.1 hypothetical protein YYE_01339 [Plasmodium vinckei vinckei]VEV57604.1 fam-c protein [Plasmodium vinckei vinckei]